MPVCMTQRNLQCPHQSRGRIAEAIWGPRELAHLSMKEESRIFSTLWLERDLKKYL